MFRPRIIPVLLLRDLGLVKSIKFKNHRYIGDPINAVKVFNDKKVDELVLLDIEATKKRRVISLDFISKVGDEADMPFAVGGGICSCKDIRSILKRGAEKVILNSAIFENPDFIKEASDTFGSSSIVVCLDVKKNIFGKYQPVFKNAEKKSKEDIVEISQKMQDDGAGEIIVQSVDRDGTFLGYDIDLIKKVSESVTIPVVSLGGAKDYTDLNLAVQKGLASAVAAGSFFVYHGSRKAVLISYPAIYEKINIFNKSLI